MIIGLSWTDTRVTKLKSLAADGLSASQIAAQLFVTRNSAMGKLYRMGVPLLRKQGKKPPRPEPTGPRIARRSPSLPMPDLNQPPDVSAFACTIAELHEGMCKWPIGDPSKIYDFRYCGAPADGSWCPRHYWIVYRPKGMRA